MDVRNQSQIVHSFARDMLHHCAYPRSTEEMTNDRLALEAMQRAVDDHAAQEAERVAESNAQVSEYTRVQKDAGSASAISAYNKKRQAVRDDHVRQSTPAPRK